MLPAHIAENIRKQILYYLQSTFAFRDRKVERQFENFLTDPDNGMFKGPWVTLRRPYRPAPEGISLPFDVPVPFHPFRHQYRAWIRLTSKSNKPISTIVTTGTGSGKTECFLYPILDHCLRTRKQGVKGIKAIVLYPMNALASDQEKRFAASVWDTPELRHAGITVGTYTGRYDPSDPGAAAGGGTKAMGPKNGISNHDVLQENPPDVLLTNYKMLDFLLMRPQDQRLWRFNNPIGSIDPSTINHQPSTILQYLVLDELHTYDGAQGSDVACLIRRLKERLGAPKGALCCVGTSATLENQDPMERAETPSDVKELSSDRLAKFASKLFEEDIPVDAVIGEDRLEVEEIVRSSEGELLLPEPTSCLPLDSEDAEAYAIRQAGVWKAPGCAIPQDTDLAAREKAVIAWTLALGDWMKRVILFRYLLEIFRDAETKREYPLTWREVVKRLAIKDLAFGAVDSFEDRHTLVVSFFALVAHAQELRSGKPYPLVPTQVQLWIRELRRIGRVVAEVPSFAWLDEPPTSIRCLPAFHCSECGESGWVGLHDPKEDAPIEAKGVEGIQLSDDASKIYRAWFGHQGRRSQHIVILAPWGEETIEGGEQGTLALEHDFICPASLVIRKGNGPCPRTEDTRRFRVRVNREATRDEKTGQVFGEQGCPRCGSQVGVFFIGSQSATLASVAIDEMFGSILNSDPKLLAFTDSVQDASHRAGFFTARTYHFTFRTALQHVIDEAGDVGVPLPEIGNRVLDFWSQKDAGRPGSIKEAMAALIPPDLQEYKPWVDFRDNDSAVTPPADLRQEIEARLTWETTSEFGLMQTHGRTMEPSGSASLGWREDFVEAAVTGLRNRIPGVSPALEKVSNDALRLWVLGMLQRYRERGALYHPYLESFAKQNFWGKYPFGNAIQGRETYPPSLRYKPHLLVTQSQREHEFVLAHTRGGMAPWHIKWARRVLQVPGVDETTLLDLMSAFLKAGSEAGILRKLHQDGTKEYYALNTTPAVLYSAAAHLKCSESDRSLVRPTRECAVWERSPSIEYYADSGVYMPQGYSPRQRYYQDRYRKGALRRVVAREHTGLLGTELREKLEHDFAHAQHADDPNVLTCTSTLEMGIDIGDLSSTMLCSIPPSTASYLQRIGRAGRATGTALILSIVNQRPHDLFFYARPEQMLKGRVEPPGCWLDASAVLVRQYMAFCFDCATHVGRLSELPRTGKQLVDDLEKKEGHIPRMFDWVTENEADLRHCFLKRLVEDIMPDTRNRFMADTQTDVLRNRVHIAANEFDRMRRELANARTRLQSQLKELDESEEDAERDVKRELTILKGRMSGLDKTSALEILTDHGLLPNYAFPERGVRFYGAIYNKHRGDQQEHKPVELTRAAGIALRELAPSNVFYTQRRQFDIQQIAVGNPQQPLMEKWAICGNCGHMRRVEDLERADATPACPQCGHAEDENSQMDVGQQRNFIEFSQSQALSYMEHYDSMSGDRNEERQREFYQVLHSLDHTIEKPSGAVGEDGLPFGIEYRASLIMRDVNVGYQGLPGTIPFGPDQKAPEDGFLVCKFCGIVVPSDENPDSVIHRRSCQARRRAEKLKQEGKSASIPSWEHVYLYRQLKSEAIRLLLPLTDDEDIDTLIACIHLGLRLRFEGNPAHLIVIPQVLPDAVTGLKKHFLVLMDAVPGGTGYLKSLYQEKDGDGREGEGIMDIFRRALVTLETCQCRKMKEAAASHDTDGCYRCIRTYHLQYNAERISRERGISLLRELVQAGERRIAKIELEEIKPDSLFGSVLEKKLVDGLRHYVEEKHGRWEKTIIKGGQGFRFSFPDSGRLWELELQPTLGIAQGVMIQSQPDFLLHCDDEAVKPIAIFTDGFQYHCHPCNRIADDMRKRRAILQSGAYHVWSITWEDLSIEAQDHNMVCHAPVADLMAKFAGTVRSSGKPSPDSKRCVRNGFQQLTAFLDCPFADSWRSLSSFAVFWPLQMLMSKRSVMGVELRDAIFRWQSGGGMPSLKHSEAGQWVYNDKAALTADVLSIAAVDDAIGNRHSKVIVVARIGDTEEEVTGSDYCERWRRFLACLNLYQFTSVFEVWSTSECREGFSPAIPFEKQSIAEAWQAIVDAVTPSMRQYAQAMALANLPIPEVEYYCDDVGDEPFAELAWPVSSGTPKKRRLAILVGDQTSFSQKWQKTGWTTVVLDDIQVKGVAWLIETIAQHAGGG
jgi:DEAD/DEAH box helicase domain-containing protein